MPEPIETRLSRLRERAERALASGRRGGEVLAVLETMTREAPDGSVHALFAHRHLAEIQLECSPWRAALHLRRVIDAGVDDDGVHALMGLCQALLGNYRAAVSAYRKAVRSSPRTPWYHHNLGHLLDVGLGDARSALDHLRIAHRLQSEEDEITASLAHCLARLGQLDEARAMAELAVTSAPRNREHKSLLEWIQGGAPDSKAPPNRASRRSVGTPQEASAASLGATPADSSGTTRHMPDAMPDAMPDMTSGMTPMTRPVVPEQVLHLLRDHMPSAGFSPAHVERAQALWADFCGGRAVRVSKPQVFAAAVEYAIAKIDPVVAVTQAQLARRYGVTPRAIATRYDEIRTALGLAPGDPRYAGRARER